MSILSYILDSYIFQRVLSLTIWFLILGVPCLIVGTLVYCTTKGAGNAAGLLVDKAAKTYRSRQQQQQKQDSHIQRSSLQPGGYGLSRRRPMADSRFDPKDLYV